MMYDVTQQQQMMDITQAPMMDITQAPMMYDVTQQQMMDVTQAPMMNDVTQPIIMDENSILKNNEQISIINNNRMYPNDINNNWSDEQLTKWKYLLCNNKFSDIPDYFLPQYYIDNKNNSDIDDFIESYKKKILKCDVITTNYNNKEFEIQYKKLSNGK